MRILIAEDDEVLANGLARAMHHSGYAVDCVNNGADADAMLKLGHAFNLIVLDIQLPKLDGFTVLRNLRERNRHVPVIILTARDSVEDRVKGLDLGADDYLSKPFNLQELEARVRALIRRGQCGTNPLLTCGSLSYDSVGRRAHIADIPVELTAREISVLEALMMRTGRVVSKEQLLECLYNYSEEASNNAIEVYIHRLRKKTEGAGITIRTIRGLGYMIGVTPSA